MFTGLIQGVGTIHLHGEGVLVEPPTSFFPLTLGESISVDGVCLTVSAIRNNDPKTKSIWDRTQCQPLHIRDNEIKCIYRTNVFSC